jgi:hypothetical protein
VANTPHSPGVPCLPEPAICFGSATPLAVLTGGSGRALLAQFGVRAQLLDCQPVAIQFKVGLGTCNGFGTLSRYEVGVILTVQDARPGKLRSGTQVVLFTVQK